MNPDVLETLALLAVWTILVVVVWAAVSLNERSNNDD
jgi:hypothetical protein